MKVPSVTCGTHGKQPQTFVCRHIIESLKSGEPKGFWWSRGPDGVWDTGDEYSTTKDAASTY